MGRRTCAGWHCFGHCRSSFLLFRILSCFVCVTLAALRTAAVINVRQSNSAPWAKTREVSTSTCEDVRATCLMFEPGGCSTVLSMTSSFGTSKLINRVDGSQIIFIRYRALGTTRGGGPSLQSTPIRRPLPSVDSVGIYRISLPHQCVDLAGGSDLISLAHQSVDLACATNV